MLDKKSARKNKGGKVGKRYVNGNLIPNCYCDSCTNNTRDKLDILYLSILWYKISNNIFHFLYIYSYLYLC